MAAILQAATLLHLEYLLPWCLALATQMDLQSRMLLCNPLKVTHAAGLILIWGCCQLKPPHLDLAVSTNKCYCVVSCQITRACNAPDVHMHAEALKPPL